MKQGKLIGLSGGLIVILLTIIIFNNREINILDEKTAQAGQYALDDESRATLKAIEALEDLVGEYLKTDDRDTINQCVMAFVRKDRYGYDLKSLSRFIWSRYTGSLNTETGVNQRDDKVLYDEAEDLVSQVGSFVDPVMGQEIDFIHMIAVIDLELTDTGDSQVEEDAYDALFSWIGDLKTFVLDTGVYVDESGNVTESDINEFVRETLGSDFSSFSGSDMRADFDGILIAKTMKENELLLSQALKTYYTEGQSRNRYTGFLSEFESEDDFVEKVRFGVMVELPVSEEGSKYDGFAEDYDGMTQLMDMFINKAGLVVEPETEELVLDGFIQYILGHAKSETNSEELISLP